MTGTELAAVLTAVGGLLFGAVAQWRSLRSDTRTQAKDDTTAVLTGYDQLMDHLHAEMDRVQTTHREEIGDLLAAVQRERAACQQEREVWEAERHRMQRAWETERRRMTDEIDTLKAQVFGLLQTQMRDPSTRTRQDDQGDG